MTLDPAVTTAIISAVVAVVGTAVTFSGRNKDSADKRLDTVFHANQQMVETLISERQELVARIEALETHREEMSRALGRLRDLVRDQSDELFQLRQREAELWSWSLEMMKWVTQAITLIRGMGGDIDEPPAPPPRRPSQI